MAHSFLRTILPALALGTALSGCGISWTNNVSGVPLAELDTSGDPPTDITLAGPDQVVITQGETFSITLEGDKEAGEALRFDRDGNKLTIARDSDIWDGRGAAIVRITMPSAHQLSIAGSGSIKADSIAAEAEIEIAGSGDIVVKQVTAKSLSVGIFGSGDVKAAGRADRLEVEIAGNGNVGLQELTADDVKIEIAGSGNVELASDGKVDVSIAGSGDVNVFGDAQCSFESAGSGSVTCKPAKKRAETTASGE